MAGRVKVDEIEAENHLEAIAKAEKQADGHSNHIEDADEHLSANVDVVGDDQYLQSKFIDFCPTQAFGSNLAKLLTSAVKILEKKHLTKEESEVLTEAKTQLEHLETLTDEVKKIDQYLSGEEKA
jgi:type II secretory pathway component PulF